MKLWQKVLAGLGTLALFGTISGAAFFLENRYAKAEDLQKNTVEVKINTARDNIRWYQDQQNYILSRCGTRDPGQLPEHAYEQWRDYERQRNEWEQRLQVLLQK